jgi:two-component system chemotaxis response regulator CheY
MSPVGNSRTVLVVDDAEDCAATLDLALQTLPGVAVMTAGSAEAALAMLEQDRVAAVITDIHLPEMSGLELISHLRAQARWRALPILVVSADPDPGTPAHALGLGANAYFAKPFSPGAVRRKLEELIDAS